MSVEDKTRALMLMRDILDDLIEAILNNVSDTDLDIESLIPVFDEKMKRFVELNGMELEVVMASFMILEGLLETMKTQLLGNISVAIEL